MARMVTAHRWLAALPIALAFAVSCRTENPLEAKLKNMPRRFVVNGKGYLLDEQQPGVIEDDAVVYTADAGARIFNFSARTVLRHLFVGKWDDFASLPANEREELKDIAGGALDFLRRLEQHQRQLSNADEQHRAILQAYVAGQSRAGTVPCDCPGEPRPRLSVGETAARLSTTRWPAPPPGARIEGYAVFEAVVSPDGAICCISAVAGHPLLVSTLGSVIRGWSFKPGKAFIGVVVVRYSSSGFQIM